MSKSRRYTVLVKFELKPGVTPKKLGRRWLRNYIEDAVHMWAGQLDPESIHFYPFAAVRCGPIHALSAAQKCPKCNNPAELPHSCPYQRDVNNDPAICCTCCAECETECRDII